MRVTSDVQYAGFSRLGWLMGNRGIGLSIRVLVVLTGLIIH